MAGIGLQGVLVVLDEPSVGLHHHDTGMLLGVVRGMRDRGNTVLVVEHDDQVILQADWVIDVGPGAGATGGEILFSGPLQTFLEAQDPAAAPRLADSRTRAFLTGAERIPIPATRREGTGSLAVEGVTRHNLHAACAEFRLGALNVVTGVSGAGKSTLVEETRRLLRGEGPGGPASVRASGRIDKIIEIDQAPIGRTPRSNPATYTGLFDHVRALFAAEPAAVARGFDKGRFSFNVRGGRCDACEGAGVQQIGMQFLGTMAATCGTCDGRRFNDATLEVRYRGATIHDVLEMPIAEALGFFEGQPPIARALGTLDALGLGYLRVGHPATMLSGGEAQRVKLAAELARPGTGRTLYVLDEPTTGLHPADIARLLAAIDGLIARGNTALVIEHHLDVIKVADWVVDLGPGSGAGGGRVVAAGTPEAVAATEGSLTGAALSARCSAPAHGAPRPPLAAGARRGGGRARTRLASTPIRFTGVTTHNLQHVDVAIPRNRLTVVTGVSGSGKSSLAFDTIFAEGRRRFAESFSAFARRFVRQDGDARVRRGIRVDANGGDPPAGALPQPAVDRGDAHRDSRRLPAALLAAGHAVTVRGAARQVGRRPLPLVRIRGRAYPDGVDVLAELRGWRVPAMPRPWPPSRMRPGEARHGSIEADRRTGPWTATRPAASTAIPTDSTWRRSTPRARRSASTSPCPGARSATALATSPLRGAGDRVFDVEWRYRRGARVGLAPLRRPVARPARTRPPRVRAQARGPARRSARTADDARALPRRAVAGRLKPEAARGPLRGREHP